MSFTTEISLGHMIPLGVFILGVIGGYYALKNLAETTSEKVMALGKRIDAHDAEIRGQALYVANYLVKKEDMREVEERIGKRIDGLDHTVRTTSDAIIKALADSLPRRTPTR